MNAGRIERILVLNRNRIGDCLLTTPLLRALKRRFPEAELEVAIPESNRDLLATNPHVDRLIFRPRIRSWGAKACFAWGLRRRGYDLVLSLQEKSSFYAWTSWLVSLTGRRAVTVGLEHPRTRRWYRHVVPIPPERHEVHKYLDVAECVGCPPEPNPVLELAPSGDARQAVSELLSLEGVDAGQRFLGLNPGASEADKRWAPEHFAAVADRVHEATGLPALLVGGPEDRAAAAAIGATMRTHAPVVVAGRATLGETAALLERCALLVTGDTGPMHMAVALAVPVVALFGPTSPAKFGPFSRNSAVLRDPDPCPQCRRPCLHTLQAPAVAAAALALLPGPATPTASP